MSGFETIGNATITIFDNESLLTTNPWIFEIPILEAGDISIKYQRNN